MKQITDFLLDFWREYFVWVNTIVPLVVALSVFGFILWKQQKPMRAIVGGFASIILLLVAVEWWIISGYLDCEKRSACEGCGLFLCGEWVGVGALLYIYHAGVAVFIFLALSIGISFLQKYIFNDLNILNPSKKFGLLISIPIILLATTAIGEYAGERFINLVNTGFFVSWVNIGKPPETTAQILGANINMVRVATVGGKTFHARLLDCLGPQHDTRQTCWTGIQIDGVMDKGDPSQCQQHFWTTRPPKEAIQYITAVWCDKFTSRQTDYALLEDGNIWVWRYEQANDTSTSVSRIGTIILSSIIGFFIGVTLAIRLFRKNLH